MMNSTDINKLGREFTLFGNDAVAYAFKLLTGKSEDTQQSKSV